MLIYNSLTKSKEPLQLPKGEMVRLYVCGMTVYDYCHIGHARSLITFDFITRYLRYRGFPVKYVRNITDIDDKIIRRAEENQEPWQALTARFIEAMHEDERALGIIPPDFEPRATEHIPQIIALIHRLIENGYAYLSEDGDVCYEVRKFADYGKLSHRHPDQLIAGVRIDVRAGKRDPLDFVLWKRSKPNEPFWDSPWGAGRPGWHIECSAMAAHWLGQPFDIHGGGMDLKFPHHENEIAQSEAAEGCCFAKLWMHIGLLMIEQEKMSKSLGNILTIRSILAQHHPEVVRYFMMSSHYRSPLNFDDEALSQARKALETLYLAVRGLNVGKTNASNDVVLAFQQALDDDFNTPQALAVLFELAREINRLKEEGRMQEAAVQAKTLYELSSIFGILQESPDQFLQGRWDIKEREEIELLVIARAKARQQKAWSDADQIRNQLEQKGVVLEDTPQGTVWRRCGV